MSEELHSQLLLLLVILELHVRHVRERLHCRVGLHLPLVSIQLGTVGHGVYDELLST